MCFIPDLFQAAVLPMLPTPTNVITTGGTFLIRNEQGSMIKIGNMIVDNALGYVLDPAPGFSGFDITVNFVIQAWQDWTRTITPPYDDLGWLDLPDEEQSLKVIAFNALSVSELGVAVCGTCAASVFASFYERTKDLYVYEFRVTAGDHAFVMISQSSSVKEQFERCDDSNEGREMCLRFLECAGTCVIDIWHNFTIVPIRRFMEGGSVVIDGVRFATNFTRQNHNTFESERLLFKSFKCAFWAKTAGRKILTEKEHRTLRIRIDDFRISANRFWRSISCANRNRLKTEIDVFSMQCYYPILQDGTRPKATFDEKKKKTFFLPEGDVMGVVAHEPDIYSYQGMFLALHDLR